MAARPEDPETLEDVLRALVPSNPKRQRSTDRRWFDYYAGYADAFVDDVIGALAEHTTTVLDPWNGAGTTTAAAAGAGLTTIGLDVNPVAVVIAKARLLMTDVEASLLPLVADVVAHARQRRDSPDGQDLLLRWLDPSTARSIRRLERSISALLVSSDDDCRLTDEGVIDGISSLAALFYLALFRTTRDLLSPFVASNPTWIRLRVDPADRLKLRFSTLVKRFRENIQDLQKAAKANEYASAPQPPRVLLGSSTKIPLRANSATAVLTSPPYCTRIDYAIATLPELAVLGYDWEQVQRLRTTLIGTPTMLAEADERAVSGSDTFDRLMQRIKRHRSYASQSYYLPFFRQYFNSMSTSLGEIDRVTRAGSPIVLVVQDSWFKNVHVDTPSIIGEFAQSIGWRVVSRHPFGVKTRATAHPHRATRRTSRATETVSVYST